MNDRSHVFIYSGNIFIILLSEDGTYPYVFRHESPAGWVLISKFPCCLRRCAVTVVDHMLLVIGGKESPTYKKSKSVHTLDLHHAGSKWSKLDSLPCDGIQPVVAVLDTSVHVFAKDVTTALSIDVNASELDCKWSYEYNQTCTPGMTGYSGPRAWVEAEGRESRSRA